MINQVGEELNKTKNFNEPLILKGSDFKKTFATDQETFAVGLIGAFGSATHPVLFIGGLR